MRRVFTLVIFLLFPSFAFAKFSISDFYKKISNQSPHLINSVNKEISSSKIVLELKDVNIKNIAKPIPKITAVAKAISSKDSFSERLITNTSKPLILISQYSRYGDDYLKNIKSLNEQIKVNATKAIELSKENPVYKNMDLSKAKQYLDEDKFNDRVIEIVDTTGKKGFDLISKLSNHSGKIAIATMAIAFINMPEDFLDIVENNQSLQNELSSLTTLVEDDNTTKDNLSISYKDEFQKLGDIVDEKEKYLQELITKGDFKLLIIIFFVFILLLILIKFFIKKSQISKEKKTMDSIKQFKDKMY